MSWWEHPPGPVGWISMAQESMSGGGSGDASGNYQCRMCQAEVPAGDTCECEEAWDAAHGI